MKWVLLLLVVGVAHGAEYVTNYVVTTNLLTASYQFRVVNGKLYNIEKSYLWPNVKGRATEVGSNYVIGVEMVKEPIQYIPAVNNRLGGVIRPSRLITRNVPGDKHFMIKNFKIETGSDIDVPAMLVGTTNLHGVQMELYDHGIPNRGWVVQTNRVIRRLP